VTFSAEYDAMFKRVGTIGAAMSLLVLATVYVMVVNS
jgi:hypothetical protein